MKNLAEAILRGTRDMPPDEYDCHYAPPDHKPTTARLWMPNRVDTAIASANVRTLVMAGEDIPETPAGHTFFSVPAPGDDAWRNPVPVEGAPSMYEPGFAEVVTIHPSRLRANLGEANEEVCHYATGVLALNDSGFAIGVIGNYSDDADATNYMGLPFIATEDMVNTENQIGMEEGYCYFAGGYLNPAVVEYHYHSPRHWCRIDI